MTETFDLTILGVMLPNVDGWRILQALRESCRQTPVLFLIARGSVDVRVKGLELGADDYLSQALRLYRAVNPDTHLSAPQRHVHPLEAAPDRQSHS